jgi:hypothetical protein
VPPASIGYVNLRATNMARINKPGYGRLQAFGAVYLRFTVFQDVARHRLVVGY